MHYLMLATFTFLDGDTSQDARQQAENLLQQDDSFCGDGGRFGSPLCDWFVIGGRWSGVLQQTLLGDEYQAAFTREFPQFVNDWYTRDLIAKHRDQLNQFWHRFGGKDEHPVNRRDSHKDCSDDDAMPLDRRLYDHFLKDHAGLATNL